MKITKKYLLEQIQKIETIIRNRKNEIKLKNYCSAEELKNIITLKNSENYKRYYEEYSKYDIYHIQYKHFKNSYSYDRFNKKILLDYLEEIITKAYELELLDGNFTY